PEEIRWIPAASEGRVERILLMAGTSVRPETVLLEMSNPQLAQSAVDADLALKAAQAQYRNLQVQLESQVLTQRAEVARVESEYTEAKLRAETDEALARLGVLSDLNLKVSKERAHLLENRRVIEEQRLANTSKALQAQLAAEQARVEQLKAVAELRHSQVEALRIRAGTMGVLQESPLKVGQWVTPGTTLAKVVQPERLKAELKIPETQGKDLALGLPASIDTRNGIIAGRVMRIDPAAVGGTVTVDVALDGALPPGARPDMNVDGTIDLERLSNVLYVGRPAFGQEKSTVSMFKLDPDGRGAFRVQVKLGRSSVSAIEILEGLNEGDEVVLSDMSRWDGFDRVRLE
ncbi:MAG: HlyD family secretion protein, partial [Burkholderiales bacterium]